MSSKQCIALREAAAKVGLSQEVMTRFIDWEWVTPAERSLDWNDQTLDAEDLARAGLIRELQEIFGVNDEAIPIILNLIDQLNRTHLEIKERLNRLSFL